MTRLPTLCAVISAGLIASSSLAAEKVVTTDPATLTQFLSLHTQGVNYELGRGTPQDFAKAAKWYGEAAKLGHADAQNDLAKLYDDGRGVTQDNIQAYFWYSLAADRGNSRAVHDRKLLLQRMSAPQLAEAQLRLHTWKSTSKGSVLTKVK